MLLGNLNSMDKNINNENTEINRNKFNFSIFYFRLSTEKKHRITKK